MSDINTYQEKKLMIFLSYAYINDYKVITNEDEIDNCVKILLADYFINNKLSNVMKTIGKWCEVLGMANKKYSFYKDNPNEFADIVKNHFRKYDVGIDEVVEFYNRQGQLLTYMLISSLARIRESGVIDFSVDIRRSIGEAIASGSFDTDIATIRIVVKDRSKLVDYYINGFPDCLESTEEVKLHLNSLISKESKNHVNYVTKKYYSN